MPITFGNVTLQSRLLPLTIYHDGHSTVVLKSGYIDSTGNFTLNTEQSFDLSVVDTQSILSGNPTPGLNRGQDLTNAIYNKLISLGLIPKGVIS